MSSGGALTKGTSVKGVSNPSNNMNNNKKSNKSDSKSDKLDLNPKIQPTAEQMQIARIIDTHRAEDPELQKKIRQVMEITRTTEDQACMALHSREYDIEQAITLLTEGGSKSLESEWAQAGKKRKQKTPNQKADIAAQKDQKGAVKEGGDRSGRDKSEKRDSTRGEKKDLEGGDGQPFVGGDQRRGGDRGSRGLGGRSRGRPGIGRGGGGGGRSGKENDEMKGGSRMLNGPGRGRGGGFGRGGRGGGRTFANRARGEREGESYHPIDVWENSQADGAREAPLKVDKWDEFPSAEDWDNEEYTGSLADTKVFTPSTQTAQGPLNDTTNGVGGPPPSNHIQSASNNLSSGDINKMSANQESGVTMSSVVRGLSSANEGSSSVSTGQNLDLSMLLSKPQQNSSASSVPAHVNPGADLLASLQSSYSNSNQVAPMGVSNQALPPRNKVQRPRGPPSKIPSSAVEMPDDPVTTTLDVQFGGMDLSSDSTLSFSSVMQGGKSGSGDNNLIYGGQGTKMETFASAAANDKDIKTGGHSASPFQNQISTQSQVSMNESGKGNVSSNISPGLDSLTSLSQNQTKTQQTGQHASYGAAVNAGNNSGSAFVSYGGGVKGAPGFPAPGFPPVSQNPAGTYNNSTVAPVTGGGVPSSYGSQPLPSQQQAVQSAYHNMGSLAYGNQPTNIPQSQPVIASASQVQNTNVPYGSGNSAPPQSAYHMNSNVNSGYTNSSSGTTQYGGYAPKMSGSMNNTSSGVSKDSSTDVNASAPVSTGSSVSSSQLVSNMQAGSGEDWNYGTDIPSSSSTNSKMSAPTNTTTNATSKMGGGGMPPGMMMQPQYILGQGGTVPAFYSVQTPMYGYEDNSVQFVPRFPPNMAGYYDASGAAGYVTGTGVPVAPGVSGRNDGTAMQAYSTGADGRFQRSDSSTASPVPSNLAGGSTQQAMYNPALPYYFVGNNMVHSTHFPYGPPHQMYQAPMATAANASGAQHAAAANHQYQSKGVYSATQYTYEQASQGGPGSDFGKTSYASGSGVGPNSNAGKGSSGSTSGVSQSTEMNSSMYAKPHNMGKMSSYDKQYGASGAGAYSSLGGAQPNVLGSQLGGAYGVYIAQQPVQTLPMHQDGGNASRQGPGQQKGKQQQYGGPPYWGN